MTVEERNEIGGFNRYYVARDQYEVDPHYLGMVQLGSGVDLSNPLDPKLRSWRAFDMPVMAEPQGRGLPISGETLVFNWRFEEGGGEAHEASLLSSYFKVSYGLHSLDAAMERATEMEQDYHTVYALLEHRGETRSLPPQALHWTSEPDSESRPDEEAWMLFLMQYGSHYVSRIEYGLRIGVQGKLKSERHSEEMSFLGSFKTAIGGFHGEGEAGYEEAKKLSEWGVELTMEVTSGGSNKGILPPMTELDQIAKFFDQLGKGEIEFSVAPIRVTLDSYWPSLDPSWEKARALLKPTTEDFQALVPSAIYGVPAGTILAWKPTSGYVEGLGAKSSGTKIHAPDGWAICDGTLGTPDLREQFIMGTGSWEEVGKADGTTEHEHGVTERYQKDEGFVWATRNVTVAAHKKEAHIPPHVKMVYIMKLP